MLAISHCPDRVKADARHRHRGSVRITLVVERFLPVADSTTTTAKALLDRLVDTGHAAQVVTIGPGLGSYRGCPGR